MENLKINEDFLNFYRENGNNSFIQAVLHKCPQVPARMKSELKTKLTSFYKFFSCKWKRAHRSLDTFKRQNKVWLQQDFLLPDGFPQQTDESPTGRPQKPFNVSSEISKRRKTKKLRYTVSAEELSFAASMQQRAEGNEAAAKIYKGVSIISKEQALQQLHHLQNLKTERKPQRQLSAIEAVSLIADADLTKEQYLLIRKVAKEHNHDLFPSYYEVLKAKKECYPKIHEISEKRCEVKLQDLLNHTITGILPLMKSENNEELEVEQYTLHLKYGFDGSGGHSRYNQKFDNTDNSDQYVFGTFLVPLRLVNKVTNEIVWENPRTSSTRFCRPVRIQWIQETTQVLQNEEADMNEQISNLQPYTASSKTVEFSLMPTMLDGKACTALTHSTSAECYICGAQSSEVNNIDLMLTRAENVESFRLGLSTLHAYIRFLECLLHVAYRLDSEQWKMSEKDGSKLLSEWRKKEIQASFKSRMGLNVDFPRQGHGTSNNGNTARRFFANPKLSAEITDVNEEIITRFGDILIALASGYLLNEEKFKTYCIDTAKLYAKLYWWYSMPPTVHKVLIHGSSVSKHLMFPIGQLSEEALEARNKDIRKYREHHARKCSRAKTNEDIFHRLLLNSCPNLSSISLSRKKPKQLPKSVLELVILPEEKTKSSDEESEECDDNTSSNECEEFENSVL